MRLSFCCGREGCRRRVLPPSVLFWGRRVYWAAVVLVVTAPCQGPPIQSHSGSPMVSQRSPRPGPSLLLRLLSQSCFPDGLVRRLAASCCLVCSAR